MPIFEQLEPRILLSADLLPLPADTDSSPVLDLQDAVLSPDQQLASEPGAETLLGQDPAESPTSSNQETTDSSGETALETTPLQTQLEQDTSKEIIFINDDIEGLEELKDDLTDNSDMQVIILDSTKNGLNQIDSALENQADKTSLQFFTHGNAGTVKIGSTWLSANNLSDYQLSIVTWGDSLSDDGDILFYGCDLTATEAGKSFIDEIAGLTGADVAASSDTTGHSTKNADWILEYETGEIETVVAVSPELQSDWLHILAEETIADNFDDEVYSGSNGTIGWVSDWIEIGDDGEASSGEVQITDDSLLITPASASDTERGISRVADLSQAASAYLSFDVDDFLSGTVSIEIREDSTSSWDTLYDHEIEIGSEDTRLRFDISAYTSTTTEIRFVSEGTHEGGPSNAIPYLSTFKIDNLNIDYTTDTWSSALWLSTDKNVNDGGQSGIEDWQETDLISLNNSNPLLGSTTDGEFSMAAQLSTFAEGANIRSLHYVTTNMVIGSTELHVGDILFSADDLDDDSFGAINATNNDIILFSLENTGDYSSGTFTIFQNNITDKKINGITLVESEVTVGGQVLQAGDILLTHDGTEENNDIFHLTKNEETIGEVTTVTYTSSKLLEGDDSNVSIDEKITGIDLIERTTTVGNTELQAGTILLSLNDEDSIHTTGGAGSLDVGISDIFAVEVTTLSSPDGSTDIGEVNASMFFYGEDVSFDSNDEKLDAFSLTVQGDIPEPTFTGVSFDATAKSITLTGTNLDYIGDVNSNVKDQLDWDKFVWDVNGDGTTTQDIIFDSSNISTVITSSTTLTINLTGNKTNEIIDTEGYAENGGTDTLTITPGFVSNSSGEVATTDGLIDAPILTSTGPSGVNLDNTNIDENTDTASVTTIIGSLSTLDADKDDTQTYSITGGADQDLFSITGADLILNDGILDYERQNSYIVTITVEDATGQTAEETLAIQVNNINEVPVLEQNNLTISEAGTVILTASNLAATDPENADSTLMFQVIGLPGGSFIYTDPDTGIASNRTNFTQAEVNLGTISFVDDGNETAPSYTVEVSDGTLTDSSEASIIFTHTNDLAEITSNTLTLSEDDLVTVTSTDLVITDPDIDPNRLFIRITAVTGGQFELESAPGTAILNFTYQQIIDNEIRFQQLGETAPNYTLELTDDTHLIGESVAIINYTATNDSPTIQNNTFTINENASVNITSGQLLATDSDHTPDQLTYYITGLSNGYFTVGGVNKTEFTQADINTNTVIFYDINGANVPAFDVEVKDADGASSGIHAADIHFNDNEAPTFNESNLTLDEGETVVLNSDNFSTTDVDTDTTNLSYSVTDVTGGRFELNSNPDVAIDTFSQDDINNNRVSFVHFGGEDAPTYTATVSDGYSTASPAANTINFNNINDAPVITVNNLISEEGKTITISDLQLSASDIDEDDLTSLTFTITDNVGGYFALGATGEEQTSFTKAQIDAGELVFVHDGSENTPDYTVTVSDGDLDSTSQNPDVTFTNVNDVPELTNNSFTVTEGDQVTLTSADIAATDIDSTAANLIFRVSGETHGYFAYAANPTTKIDHFDQGEILAEKIVFVHDGSEGTSTYLISVEDYGVDTKSTIPVSGTVTVIPRNDAPILSVNSLTISEGEAVQLDGSILAATDADNNITELSYSVTDLQAGFFAYSDNLSTAITHFSQTDLDTGKVYVIHDGSEVALEYSIAVSDGTDTTLTSPATITFNFENDAPTITNSATNDSYTEDTAKLLTGIQIDDVDAGSTYQVTLALSHLQAGSLSENIIGTAASTFTGGILTITGTDINDVNTILGATIYTPAAHYNADVTISINATDGITPATSSSRTLHAISVNDAPVATGLTQSGNYLEDTSYDLQNIVISDVDQDETVTATLTLASPDHGSLSNEGGATFDATSGIWTVTGNVTSVNNALASVTFIPTNDSFTDTSITVEIEDGKEDGVASLSGTINLNGTAVADTPIVSNVQTVPSTPTEPIYITANSVDGAEITSFQITEITNGKLYLLDGLTVIADNDFITATEGAAGLIFTPDSADQGSFNVKASQDGITISPASTSATSTITIIEAMVPTSITTGEPLNNGITTNTGTNDSELLQEPLEEPLEEQSGLEETLDLVAGQDTGTPEIIPKEDISSTKENEAESNEAKSDTENMGDENLDKIFSYISARNFSTAEADTGFAITAAFENLSFDLSFAQATVRSFSFSSSNSQVINSESTSLNTTSEVAHSFTISDYNLLDLDYRDRSFEEYQSVRKSLENFRDQTDQEASLERTVVGSAIAASTGLSAGYVIWLLRSGALLSSILSSLPAWQLTDPLAVLAGAKGNDEEEDESIESIIKKGTDQPTTDEHTSGPLKDTIAD